VKLNELKELAKKILVEQGQHLPQAFISRKDGSMAIVALCIEDSNKDAMRKLLIKIVRESEAASYFLVMEAYMSSAGKGMPYIPPSKSVERKDCLIISKYSKDMRNDTIVVPFHKDKGNKIIFEEEIKVGESVSTWNAYLEEEGIQERMELDVKRINDDFFKDMAKRFTDKYSGEMFFKMSLAERKKALDDFVKEERSRVDKKRFE